MKTPMLEPDEILSIVRTTADRLDALAAVAPPEAFEPTAYDAEWSMAGILAHLRACNHVLGGNIVRIVREDHPAWRAMSPRTWQQRSGYHEVAFRSAFEAFRAERARLLEDLSTLGSDAWARTATVTVPPKKVFEYSARYYGDWLAAHERAHLRHLERELRGRA
ncbi:MAG TPA: DinB family protein [Candidatus Binatia bacterium]|nr:DinB family protein [Candidatus Binatia bacterium]